MRFPSSFCVAFVLCSVVWVSSLAMAAEPEEFSAEQLEFFEKRIRPVLVEHCYECHDAEEPKGGLLLTSRAAILKGGDSGPAIVPGKLDAGELLNALAYDPAGYQMPPDGKLDDALIADFRQWIEMGAPWPTSEKADGVESTMVDLAERAKHWSFQPLTNPVIPSVQDSVWCRTPLDNFILSRLEETRLPHAAPADKAVWLRRIYFDVLGLPPQPDDVTEFLNDTEPGAHQRVIDRLLANPHFGERWGRHWLDLVRYAESRGHEFDYDVANPWHYRDYVIRALNADLPYDQFVREHVAGDLLGDQTRIDPASGRNESILATGFWYLGEWVHSPVDIRAEEAERFDNMIDVYSKTFLGLTVACARCHDHKFDPILQQDFYALQGFLQSTTYRQARFETMVQEQQLNQKLQALREEAGVALSKAFADLVEPTVNDVDKYLLAAQSLLAEGVELQTPQSDLILADFETGTYAGWNATGDAFGTKPHSTETLAPYQGAVNFTGKFLVNSHQVQGQGDAHTGQLTSDPFVIQHNYLQMWVGGGAHVGKTCVNLEVDDQVVRTVTGKNDNQMSFVEWDLRDLQGKTARLQAVDQEMGGWGNIGFDHVVLSQRSRGDRVRLRPEDFAPAMERRLVNTAREFGVHRSILAEWVAELASAEPHGLLDPFLTNAPGSSDVIPAAASSSERPISLLDAFLETPAVHLLADYRQGGAITDGPLFATGPHRPGTPLLNLDGGAPISGLEEVGGIRRDRFWDGLAVAPGTIGDPGNTEGWQRGGRMLQTPAFEITQPKVMALVRGACRSYACVDSHITIRGPLHGSLTRDHGPNPAWHWIEHDVARYVGHRAHVEFVPLENEEFSIAVVVQVPGGTSLPTVMSIVPQLPADQSLTDSSRADSLRKLLEGAIDLLYQDSTSQPVSFSPAELVAAGNWLLSHPGLVGLDADNLARWEKLAAPYRERYQQLRAQRPLVSHTAPGMLASTPEEEYVFIRGNWKKRGAAAPREYLTVFRELSAPAQRETSRRTLAEDMLDPDRTPITARVIVNRIWQHYFGRGIVPTPDDLGHLGQPPSHPELLDWLAQELIAHDWSQKHIHRLILESATYRMGSGTLTDPRIATVDPNNVLLHRMNVKRLEGEIVRDALLAISGRLDETQQGPSVPIHLNEFLEGRGRPQNGPLDGGGRRSVYLSVRRNFLDPFLQAFDFPIPHTTIGRRSVSNVPAQALALMNNDMVVDQAQVWARRLLNEHPDQTSRITAAYQETFQRPPTAAEVQQASEFLKAQGGDYQVGPDDARVWTDFCQVLWNSKELIFVR